MEMYPDPLLSSEQQVRIEQLSSREREVIDSQIRNNCSSNWRKVVRIVGETMSSRPNDFQGIPDVYFAKRIYKLVEMGDLEFQGKLGYMQVCEVRIVSS